MASTKISQRFLGFGSKSSNVLFAWRIHCVSLRFLSFIVAKLEDWSSVVWDIPERRRNVISDVVLMLCQRSFVDPDPALK